MGTPHNNGYFVGPCWKCKCETWLPTELYNAAKRSSKISFFCAYGHGQCFSEGESEETRLRRERDRLQQQLAYKDDMLRVAEQELDVQSKLVANLKTQRKVVRKRQAAGLCPCCNRSFRQMALHMKNMHPQFLASEVH